MKVVLTDKLGNEHVVTEKMKFLYGHIYGCMERSSGFLSTEEDLDVYEIGILLGEDDGALDAAVKSADHDVEVYDRLTADKYNSHIFATPDYYKKVRDEKRELSVRLKQIRDARADLLKQTDDVTDFDE